MKKRKDGLYAAQVYLGSEPVLDESGKPVLDKNGKPKLRRKYKTIYATKQKDAKAKATELRLKLGKGIDIAAAEESFSVWSERFIKNKKAEGIGFSHLANMDSFNNHLSSIHKTELAKVTAADMQAIIDDLAVYHGGKKPLSKRTLSGIKQFAGQVYKMAIGARVVDYNPATYVKIPKDAASNPRTSIPEAHNRWINDTPHKVQTAAMLMLYAGLRLGETLALTWADIDFTDMSITVNKALGYEGERPKLKSTKTPAGMRTVDIPDILVDYLEEQRGKDDCLLIVHSRRGEYLNRTAWYYHWNSYLRLLKGKYGDNPTFESFTPHQLRHSFCTMLYAAGYSLLEARDQMGHKDIQTTANIYTHLDKLNGRKTKGKLSKYLCKYDASMEEENISLDG